MAADETRRIQRRREHDRWFAAWRVSVRIGYPPGRLWRVVAALAMAGITCGPSFTLLFAMQALEVHAWMRIAFLIPAVVLPLMWRFALSGSGLREEAGDAAADAAN